MPTTPYFPPAPTSQGSNLSQADYMWMLIVQGLAPLYEVDTSKGSYSEALPPAGVVTAGQTGQGKEIIYVKTSPDANTDTITGAKTGPVTLSTQYQVARFKSDGTYWYAVNSSSGGSLALQVNGTPNADQALLNLFAGSNVTITDDGSGKIVIAASSGGASFSTSGQGWFAGPGMLDGSSLFMNSATYPITNYSSNTVLVFQFVLQSAWRLSSCAYQLSNVASAGNTFNFGIYNAAKAKLIDAAFDGTISTLQNIGFSGVTLPAGVYYFAASATSTSSEGPAAQPGATPLQILAALNAASPKIATAANAASGGALPATLGALTAATVVNWQSIPLPIWAV